MEMRKTSLWISRSFGLLFVFSSFGNLIGGGYQKSQIAQIAQKGTKYSQVSASTGRMATLQRVFKKYWYLAIPAIGAGVFCARQFKNNSVVHNDKSNLVERKPKAEQSGAAQEVSEQPDQTEVQPLEGEGSLVETSVSVDAQEETRPEKLFVLEDDVAKSSEPTESLTSENNSAWSKALPIVVGIGTGLLLLIIGKETFGYYKAEAYSKRVGEAYSKRVGEAYQSLNGDLNRRYRSENHESYQNTHQAGGYRDVISQLSQDDRYKKAYKKAYYSGVLRELVNKGQGGLRTSY